MERILSSVTREVLELIMDSVFKPVEHDFCR